MLPLTSAALALLASWLAAPVGDDWQEPANKGLKAYRAKQYAEAIVEYEKAVEMKSMPEPIRPMVTYDLACCYALVGEKEKAVAAVVKAIDGGFDNYDHVKKDEDLKSVIDDERIADAFKRNEPMRAEREAKAKKEQEAEMQKALDEALAQIKNPKGAGFDFDFDLKTLDGKPLTKKSLEGKVVIVDIWGTWCPPCRGEIPSFVKLMKKHEKEPFMIVGLNDEDRQQNKNAEAAAKKATDFAKEMGINYTLALIDTPTIKQVPGFEGYPTTLFLDKKGKVRLSEVGARPFEYLDGIVTAMLKDDGAAKPAGKKTP